MLKGVAAGIAVLVVTWSTEGIARQTVFNDDNYTPREIVNRLPPAQKIERPQARRVNQGISGRKHPVYVRWTDARGNLHRWTTHLDYKNSEIDVMSMCSNLRRGSIEYRNCRKGGNDWLKGKCRSREHLSKVWRDMYCSAASRYWP